MGAVGEESPFLSHCPGSKSPPGHGSQKTRYRKPLHVQITHHSPQAQQTLGERMAFHGAPAGCKMLFIYPPVRFKTSHQLSSEGVIPTSLHTKKLTQVCTADDRQRFDFDLGLQDSGRPKSAPAGWTCLGQPEGLPEGRRESDWRVTFRAREPDAPEVRGQKWPATGPRG